MYVYMRVACVCACARVCVCVYSLYAFVRIPIWNNEILMAIVVRWHLKPLSIQSMAERKTDRRGRLHCLGILLKTSSFSTAAADDDGIAGDDARFHLSAAEDASAVSMALSHSLTVWCTSLPHQTKISRSHCLLSLLSLLIVGCCRRWCDAAAAAMIGAVRCVVVSERCFISSSSSSRRLWTASVSVSAANNGRELPSEDETHETLYTDWAQVLTLNSLFTIYRCV